jgi:hypothetical protein
MMFVAIGVVLFAWGVLVERSSRVVGTVLALVPVVVWGGFLFAMQIDGDLDSREAADHAMAMVVGLLAFTLGSSIDSIRAAWRRFRRRGASRD